MGFRRFKGMEYITSRNNRTIIEAAKLKDRKYRELTGLYCFEGRKLFEEALTSGTPIVKVFARENYSETVKNLLDRTDASIYTVTESVYAKLTEDKAPDGIFAVAKIPTEPACIKGSCFILSEVRDPGNIGTCIRSARAFGIDTLILHSCADIYNPKVIRSTMGAFFRQNMLICEDIISTIDTLTNMGYRVLPTTLSDNSLSLSNTKINQKTVFIVGNEGHGISQQVTEHCKTSVIIPMQGDTESLNASVAASVLMWEISKCKI
ncbi:MAG: RNA methyltransferase [Clostridia bacterium]|nr:RNA methyltransferase [Clostridia bacterium]